MTPDERKASRAICEAATEGPWGVEFQQLGYWPLRIRTLSRLYDEENCTIATHENNALSSVRYGDSSYVTHHEETANYKLMAHARQALPAALDEIETREGMCDQKDARIAWLEKCEKEKDARIAELEALIKIHQAESDKSALVKELDAKDRQLAENAMYIAQLEEAAVELIGEKELEG